MQHRNVVVATSVVPKKWHAIDDDVLPETVVDPLRRIEGKASSRSRKKMIAEERKGEANGN